MSDLEVLVYPVLLYLIFASITPIECPTIVCWICAYMCVNKFIN